MQGSQAGTSLISGAALKGWLGGCIRLMSQSSATGQIKIIAQINTLKELGCLTTGESEHREDKASVGVAQRKILNCASFDFSADCNSFTTQASELSNGRQRRQRQQHHRRWWSIYRRRPRRADASVLGSSRAFTRRAHRSACLVFVVSLIISQLHTDDER